MRRGVILKKKTKETILIGVGLVILSLILHYAHYLIFEDAHHTMIFLFADIAFIPMEVFFTTLILDRFLEKREKEHLIGKLNMLVGVFYTELGTDLLHDFVYGDNEIEDLRENAIVNITWDNESFKNLNKHVMNHKYEIDINKINLEQLRDKLDKNKNLLITLITNENLLDHETFTEMLVSIMHLREELDTRYSNHMEEYEISHIKTDLAVAYKYLTLEWSYYINYLRREYPQLFLKALINNPFDKRSKIEKDSIYLSRV